MREWTRAVGDMGAVMFDEDPKHPVELGARYVLAGGDQGPLDHAARTPADHSPRIIIGYRRQVFAGQHKIEGRNQIGRAIDQRAVKIKNNGEHDGVLIPAFASLREQNYVRTRIAAVSQIHSLS